MSTYSDALGTHAYAGEFIVSEANGHRSREVVTLASTGADSDPVLGGTVLGKITASGKYEALDLAGEDGSEDPTAILYATKDASGGDVKAVVLARDCEVNSKEIAYPSGATDNQKATINAALAAFGIIVRTGI